MDNYEKIQVILDAHPSGAPKSPLFDKILRILFTPEEAAVAACMNFAPKTAEAVAKEADLPVERVSGLLEAMAEKAVIFSKVKDGVVRYTLLPTIPGLFEFPFMRGAMTPEQARLGKLWKEYHHEALAASFAGSETPLARVIPVEESIDARHAVHPYEEVSKLIAMADFIAVAQCACRVSVGACDKLREACLIFDAPGRFLVERGFARPLTAAEALDVLDRAEEAGLIHVSNNSADRANFICNCCSCCCTILRGETELHLPHAFARSAFAARIDDALCTSCGICADERCPMGAIDAGDTSYTVDAETCVGCGLCISSCPVDAITLERREETTVIPATTRDMGMRVLSEKGKLEAFLRAMK